MSTPTADVVVTGLGATTPLGGDVTSTWEALLAGRSGVSRITDDLDVDSLSMVEIATAVEDKFGVAIPDDELGNIKTVGDAISYIEKNQD